MPVISTVWDRWIDRPVSDWLFSIALAYVAHRFALWEFVEVREHGAFYQTAASISLGLLSLGGVAVTLPVTVPPSDRLKRALSEAGHQLIAIMFKCLFGLILATLLFLALFCIDTGPLAPVRSAVFIIAMGLTVLRSLRLLWLLQRILRLLI